MKKDKVKGNNYSKFVHSRLKEVEKWSRKQITERKIAELLGISYSSYNQYKKTYPAIQEAIDKGRSDLVTDVSGAMLKRALGYTYKEVVEEVVNSVVEGQLKVVGTKTKTTTKHVAGDVGAQVILRKQYDRKRITGHSFTNRDEGEENDKKRDLDIKESRTDDGWE